MGLAAGGRMRQEIYPDPHGLDTWDQASYGRVFVHIVNSQLWREITGEPCPPTPVDARAYTDAGLPWFELYDDQLGDIPRLATCWPTSSRVGEKDAAARLHRPAGRHAAADAERQAARELGARRQMVKLAPRQPTDR